MAQFCSVQRLSGSDNCEECVRCVGVLFKVANLLHCDYLGKLYWFYNIDTVFLLSIMIVKCSLHEISVCKMHASSFLFLDSIHCQDRSYP